MWRSLQDVHSNSRALVTIAIFRTIISIGLITTLGKAVCCILVPTACKVEMRVKRQLVWQVSDDFWMQLSYHYWSYCFYFRRFVYLNIYLLYVSVYLSYLLRLQKIAANCLWNMLITLCRESGKQYSHWNKLKFSKLRFLSNSLNYISIEIYKQTKKLKSRKQL